MRSPNLFLPIACLMALAAAPATAQATQLDVKTGLWEMTSTIQMHGPVIPPEALAQMPPAMRDKMTAMIQGCKSRKSTNPA